MAPSASARPGLSHVWPVSRFWSAVMFFRASTPGSSVAKAPGATGPGGAGGAAFAVVSGAAVWVERAGAQGGPRDQGDHGDGDERIRQRHPRPGAVPAELAGAADLRQPGVSQDRPDGREHEREDQRQRRQHVDGRPVAAVRAAA